MSNNALKAYHEGKMPASKIVSHLHKKGLKGLTTQILRSVIQPEEWHHTSKHYNRTNFYSIESVFLARKELRLLIKTIKKEKPISLFKCYNIEKWDIRTWDWSITKRHGNYTHGFDFIKNLVIQQLKLALKERHVKHLTQKRIAKEKIRAAIRILRAIKDAL